MRVDEIGDYERRRALLDRVGQEFKGDVYVGALAFGLEVDDLPYDQQNVLPALLGGNEFLDFVGEEIKAYLVLSRTPLNITPRPLKAL